MAAEFVGGAFLTASFQVLFEKLASKEVVKFIQGKNPINGLLKKLKIMLLSANIVLDDAEEKQITSQMVREWLDELKEATFDAQDLIFDIENEALRLKVMEGHGGLGSLRSKALKLVSITSFGSLFEKGIEHRLDKMVDRFEAILRQKDVLGLKECVQNRPLDRFLAPPSLVEESGVFGRNGDKEALVKLVLSDEVRGERVAVIPVVGMGGIGKTTLVQLVYEEDRVRKRFDFKVWVTVSYEFDVLRVAKALLEGITSRGCDVQDPYQLQASLKEGLRGKKFLFVLDDVWNENYARWDALRCIFECGAQGSKVIVTTRSESVASVTRNVPSYHLKTISDEDCWSLFVKHAFGTDPGRLANPDLEVIGRKILYKCKGLPLAVKSLGGLLRYQQNPDKWEKVLKSDIWELSKEDNSILPALWLSYYYLPSHLKLCFVYCSIFPKDYEFNKKELVLMWMGEHLLQPQRNKTIEEVGEECFDALLSRSLFQHSNKPQCFTMHDLVSDLAAFVSGEFSARLGDDSLPIVSNRTRHLSYNMKGSSHFEKLEALSKVKLLRTFLGVGWQNVKQTFPHDSLVHELLPELLCLQVLSLSCCPIKELPDTIGNLKNLRYLNLSWTEIKEVPNTVCSLYNLQTLLLAFCGYLTQLPTDIGNLINMRHLDIQGTNLRETPLQFGKLRELQTLPSFILGKDNGSRIKLLRELKQLRGNLCISGLENVDDVNDVVEANLRDKQHICNLTLQWERLQADDSNKEKEVFEKLQPHTSLKRLFIDSYRGTKFPNWLGDRSYSYLVLLTLHGCKNCYLLPPLGQLPLLQQLQICDCDEVVRIGEEFYGNAYSLTKPFRSLKLLSFVLMLEWREWSFIGHNKESEIFPVLEDLDLKDCLKLNVKLRHCTFPSLKSLVFSNCHELDSFEGVASNLTSLSISDCGKLLPNLLNGDMRRLGSLRYLKIMDHKDLVDSFPKEGTLLPSSLTHLWIINLPNLKALNGKAFRCHQSLEELRINGCSQLKCLPEEGLPSSLNYLSFYFCHSLSKRCERDTGEDWPKIAHVYRVCIDGMSI